MKKIILTNSFKRPRASNTSNGRSLCDNNVKYTNVFATIEEIIFLITNKLNATPLILAASNNEYDVENIVKFVDGIILPGAASNIYPARYKDFEILPNQTFDQNHDSLDFKIIEYALKYDKPILGICRGMQAMNVYCGGTLFQKLPESNVNHLISYKNEGMTEEDKYLHNINIVENGLLFKEINQSQLKVNSIHEQAIKILAKSLQVEALAEDNIIEAISMKDKKFFLGVQWHPEALQDQQISNIIFNLFVKKL